MRGLAAWDFELDELPFRAQLHRAAVRLTRSTDRAEDLLQDTYLKAYRAYHTFRPGTNLKAWLFKILLNTFITEYRQRQRVPAMVDIADCEWSLWPAPASALGPVVRTPEDEVMEASLDGEVRQALAALPHVFKTAVLLADLEGYTYKEVAAILSIPLGTVMSRLYRGRKLLERAMLSFGVRYNYLTHKPRRLRSSDLACGQLLGLAGGSGEVGGATAGMLQPREACSRGERGDRGERQEGMVSGGTRWGG